MPARSASLLAAFAVWTLLFLPSMLAGASPRAVFLLLLSALLFWPLAVWRPLRIVSVLFLAILGAANIVHDGFFGYLIDEFFIASSLRTTSSETREFLTSLPMGAMVWCAVWLLLCVGIVYFMARKANEPGLRGSASQRLAATALLIWAGFFGYSHWTGSLDTTSALRKLHIVYPLHIANAGWRQYQITDALLYTPLLPEPAAPSPQSQVDTMVVVLGESASAHRWSLLGYQQAPTNASLQEIPGLQVARVLANGLNTAAALPYMLTGLSALDSVTHQAPSFIDLAHHAGYKTIVLNNSRYLRTGEDFLTHALRRSANVYLKVGDGDYDEVLTAALQTALQDPAPRKLIVLHTYGSHVTAASRYPKTAHQLADSYDTSIRYTSDLLAQWIRMLDASSPQQSALLLYASDHGVVVPPCSGSSRSGGSLSSYEIPALAWANPVSLAQHPRLLTPLRQQDPAQVHMNNAVIPEIATQALGYPLQALSPTHRPRQVLLDAEGHPWERSKAQLCQGQSE